MNPTQGGSLLRGAFSAACTALNSPQGKVAVAAVKGFAEKHFPSLVRRFDPVKLRQHCERANAYLNSGDGRIGQYANDVLIKIEEKVRDKLMDAYVAYMRRKANSGASSGPSGERASPPRQTPGQHSHANAGQATNHTAQTGPNPSPGVALTPEDMATIRSIRTPEDALKVVHQLFGDGLDIHEMQALERQFAYASQHATEGDDNELDRHAFRKGCAFLADALRESARPTAS